MKRKFFFFIVFAFSVSISGAQIPEINQEIVTYVKSVIGTKVGRGECWDLAKNALTLVNAKWDHRTAFGIKVDPKKDTIYPGDIIQFENVVLKYKSDKGLVEETFPHHTAIVYEVIAPGEYKIAHQNTGYTGKKVGVSGLRIADKKAGKWQFYQPQPQ
jgi:hypothetical protein